MSTNALPYQYFFYFVLQKYAKFTSFTCFQVIYKHFFKTFILLVYKSW
jgi:hypothetical protein